MQPAWQSPQPTSMVTSQPSDAGCASHQVPCPTAFGSLRLIPSNSGLRARTADMASSALSTTSPAAPLEGEAVAAEPLGVAAGPLAVAPLPAGPLGVAPVAMA